MFFGKRKRKAQREAAKQQSTPGFIQGTPAVTGREKAQSWDLQGPEPPRTLPLPKDTLGADGNNRLLHGTARDIEGAILPASVHGQGLTNKETPGPIVGNKFRTPERIEEDRWLRHNKAYATPNEDYAWDKFAHATADRGGGRGRVYEVEPQPDMRPGAFTKEYVADKFPISQQFDIKPGHQGTFPIDWRPYATPKYQGGEGSDEFINHPSPFHEMVAKKQAEMKERGEYTPPEPEHPGQGTLFDIGWDGEAGNYVPLDKE